MNSVWVLMNDIWYNENKATRNLIDVYYKESDAEEAVERLNNETILFTVDGKDIPIRHDAHVVKKKIIFDVNYIGEED